MTAPTDEFDHLSHGDPFLSPWQTNPTAGTPEDAEAQLDMARDLDREGTITDG